MTRTAHFENVNNSLNTNIYFYWETSGGQRSNLYLNVVKMDIFDNLRQLFSSIGV